MNNMIKNIAIYLEQLKSLDVPPEAKDKINVICQQLEKTTDDIEGQLAQTLMEQRIILESASLGILLLKNRKVVWANNSFSEFSGYNRVEILGMDSIMFYTSIESYEKIGREAYPLLAIGQTFQTEIEMKKKDGSLYWCLLRGKAINPADPFTGSIWIAEDISQRKEFEAELINEKERAQMYLDYAGTILIAIDKDQRLTLINKKGCAVLGYSEGEILGLNWFDLTLPKDVRETVKFIINKILDGKIDQEEYFENPVITKNGTLRLIAWHNTYLKDDAGNIYGIFSSGEDITERKNAELALIESENKFKSMFENHSAMMIVVDPVQMKPVDVNNAAIKFYGYSREEFTRLKVFDLLADKSPEYTQYVMSQIKYLACGEKTFVTFKHVLKNGEIKDIELRTALIDVNDKKLLFSIIQDITMRIRVEEALKESEENYRTLLNNISVGVFRNTADTKGRVVQGNRALAEILGFDSIQELYEHSVSDFYLNPDDRKGFLSELSKTGQVKNMEMRLKKKDNTPIWAYISATAEYDESGNIKWLDGFIDDITENKLISEKLLESEKKYRELVESAKSIIMRWNTEGTITFINKFALELFGYAEQDIIGRNVIGAIITESDKDIEMFMALKKDMISCPTMLNTYEHSIIRNDSQIWISWTNKIIYDEKSDKYEILSIGTDVTYRKHTEEQFKIAKQAAEAANQTTRYFLANMSHEIRTPMNAIIGMTNLCLQTEITSKQRDYLTKIDFASKSLLGIINDILDFSKIEAGKLSIEEMEFSLDDVLDSLTTMVSQKAAEKGLELLFKIGSDVPILLKGDPLRLGQVLTNLVNNAVKFTETGEIVLTVDKVQEVDNKITLRFSILDTGIGLTKEQIDTLFKPFTQADGSITRKYGGTGLGLTICKRLVEMMEGGIMVKSELGVGSNFIFTARLNVIAQRKPLNFPPDLHNIKALIVVALKSSAEILINILESFSFNVTCALSGTEAIALIKDSAVQYDLIVMDCNMPKLDGIGTAKQIKNISPVPIIIMSSVNGLNDVYEKVKESGIEGFLVKPVTQSILFDAIMDVFGKSRRSTPIQSRGSTPIQSRGSTPIKGRRTTPINKRWSYDNNENIGVETPHYKNITILLVEDNEINQQVAMELMEKTGLIVEIASNGKEAVEMVNKSRYDAVLMDIQMPVMDGYSAAIEIRKNPDFKYLPILAMTANAMTGDREKSLKAGMNDHISKPIDPIELFTILDIWLKNDNVMGALISNTQPVIAKQLELNGIDTKVGLQRVGSNQEFYINMLKKFSINQKNTIDEIQSAIAIGDFELAIRLAHTLKGISGTIGASIVSRVSGVLEDALTKGDTEAVNAQITIVKMELDIVLAAIDGLKANDNQGQRPIDNQGYNIDIKELKELTGKISEFLKDDDTQAIQYIQRLKEQFPEISAMNEFKRLEAMIERYDFEGSLEILNRMTEILRI